MSHFNFQSIKKFNIEQQPQQNYNQTEQHYNQVKGKALFNQNLQQKTRLTKKYTVNGFQLVDLVWIRPAEGIHKYQILVKYIDPEQPRTKRQDGSYQKIIKIGQKGAIDFVDPPYSQEVKNKNTKRLKVNIDNPLHSNFYYINLLNGPTTDIYQNFNILKKQIFS